MSADDYSNRSLPHLSRHLELTSSSVEVMHVVGLIYYEGIGTTKDIDKAVLLFVQAANMGYLPAQYMLGICYICGYGVPKDDKIAIEWLSKSAEGGYVMTQNHFADDYNHGHIVSKDLIKAKYWFSKAAEQGLKSAIRMVKECDNMPNK